MTKTIKTDMVPSSVAYWLESQWHDITKEIPEPNTTVSIAFYDEENGWMLSGEGWELHDGFLIGIESGHEINTGDPSDNPGEEFGAPWTNIHWRLTYGFLPNFIPAKYA